MWSELCRNHCMLFILLQTGDVPRLTDVVPPEVVEQTLPPAPQQVDAVPVSAAAVLVAVAGHGATLRDRGPKAGATPQTHTGVTPNCP